MYDAFHYSSASFMQYEFIYVFTNEPLMTNRNVCNDGCYYTGKMIKSSYVLPARVLYCQPLREKLHLPLIMGRGIFDRNHHHNNLLFITLS